MIAEPHNKLSKASHNFHLGLSSRHYVESCECRIKKLNGVELMHFAYRREGNSILKEMLEPVLPARSSDGTSYTAGTLTENRQMDRGEIIYYQLILGTRNCRVREERDCLHYM